MSEMTLTDYEVEDYHQTRYEIWREQAKCDWLDELQIIQQKFEHLLTDEPICDVPLKDIMLIAKGYYDMMDIEDYVYQPDDDGGEILYNFKEELKADLLDMYGWEVWYA